MKREHELDRPPASPALRPALPEAAAPAGPSGGDGTVRNARATIVAYDAEWQFSAITEQHAFAMAKRLLPCAPGVVYLAFPWATLIETVHGDLVGKDGLLRALDALTPTIQRGSRVVTVAQHSLAKRYIELFERAGVTDLFWSHAAKGETALGTDGKIRVLPFPLYPVRYGHRSGGDEPWAGLVDQDAGKRLRDLLATGQFSLCPSDAGPNPIGVWEAIGAGSIPVIASDIWAPPGNPALWEEAAVFCKTTPDALRALPERLEKMVGAPALMRTKRRALRQLWMLYGPGDFIYDVRALFVAAASANDVPPAAFGDGGSPSAGRAIKLMLYGRHSNRTPLSYAPYRTMAQGRIEIVTRPRDAEILIAGFDIDLWDNAKEVASILRQKPRLKVALLSEEPLWDTVWSKAGYKERNCRLAAVGKEEILYVAFNHFTSSVYRFGRLPYFITASDDFFVRYARLFQRNAQMSPGALLQHWRTAPVRAAFYAERRTGTNYDMQRPDEGLFGLSSYRTRIAELAGSDGVLRVGKDWEPGRLRQQLPDWHLDKLAMLDRRARIVSGLENTHVADYITEKIFDAFAVQAIPLYYASPEHRVFELVAEGSFLNLFGMDAPDAAKLVAGFTPDEAFAETYLATQRRLAGLFSDPATLKAERRRVIAAIIQELDQIVSGARARRNDLASMFHGLVGRAPSRNE